MTWQKHFEIAIKSANSGKTNSASLLTVASPWVLVSIYGFNQAQYKSETLGFCSKTFLMTLELTLKLISYIILLLKDFHSVFRAILEQLQNKWSVVSGFLFACMKLLY